MRESHLRLDFLDNFNFLIMRALLPFSLASINRLGNTLQLVLMLQ
jgi:hypothetical protein